MTKDKNKAFQEKANSYLCCFNEHCPIHTHCLRWEVGQFINPSVSVITCVNPRYNAFTDDHCEHYRDDQLVTMPVGMKTRFYRDMPARIAQAIKGALIAHNSRGTYYKYHRGERPITPAYLALIQRVCLENGWQGPLEFDSVPTMCGNHISRRCHKTTFWLK